MESQNFAPQRHQITANSPIQSALEAVLRSLDLRDTIGITSLEPLEGLTNLSWLNVNNATSITSLEPLKGLTNLRSLHLDAAAGITNLEALKGLRLRIYGASDELLATMN